MDVPITFEYKGKTYSGIFSSGSGMGSGPGEHWQLMIDNYYFGALHYSRAADRFFFHGNSFEDEGMGDFFEFYLVSYFQ